MWSRLRHVTLIAISCASCVFPGGELSGDVAPPPESWAFLGNDAPCRLETAAPEPRAVRVGCYAVGDVLHVHSHRWTNAPRLWGSSWVEEIELNPAVRIEIEGVIYRLEAEEVRDEDLRTRILGDRGHVPPPQGMRLFRFFPRKS